MKNRQVDKKLTMQVRIDSELHRRIKIKASTLSVSVKTLLEGLIIEDLKEETSQN